MRGLFSGRLLSFIVIFCVFRARCLAQEPTINLDELAPLAEQWMRENLDQDFLKSLGGIDEQRARSLFDELTRRLQNDSVYDLGALKDTASTLLPVLEGLDETRPYASWLKTHLDYLIVADDWRSAQPRPKPGTAPLNPSVDVQNEAWQKQMAKRPMPVRAQTYVPRLKSIFLAQDVPSPLVWLAEVESSFDPTARSPAGAAGMFQLMPTTARSLGLSLSPKDERLDPDKSARAAAKYLRHLYGRFGEWHLALAAYNAGETRVNNLLTRNNTRNYSVIAPRLPAETQMYVPKIEATLRKREGLVLTTLRLPKS